MPLSNVGAVLKMSLGLFPAEPNVPPPAAFEKFTVAPALRVKLLRVNTAKEAGGD